MAYKIAALRVALVGPYCLKRDKTYELRLKSGSGEVKSSVIKGFSIPIRAIFDRGENLRILRGLLRT